MRSLKSSTTRSKATGYCQWLVGSTRIPSTQNSEFKTQNKIIWGWTPRSHKTKLCGRLFENTMLWDDMIKAFLLEQSNCFKETWTLCAMETNIVNIHNFYKLGRSHLIENGVRYRSPWTVTAVTSSSLKNRTTPPAQIGHHTPCGKLKFSNKVFLFTISSHAALLNQKWIRKITKLFRSWSLRSKLYLPTSSQTFCIIKGKKKKGEHMPDNIFQSYIKNFTFLDNFMLRCLSPEPSSNVRLLRLIQIYSSKLYRPN